jgi:endoglucanase
LKIINSEETTMANKLLFLAASMLALSAGAFSQQIKINQLGFNSGSTKLAIVPETSSAVFEVISIASGQAAYSGELTVARYDGASGDRVSVADFTELSLPGKYFIKAGAETSHIFDIKESGVYTALSKSTVRAFYYWRASIAIEPQYAQEGSNNFARPFGHPDTEGIIHSTAADEFRKAGEIYPSAKGWYDAGDYNKYVVNAAPAVHPMLHAYEMNPGYYAALDLNIPESGNGIPDILNEVKWETDWLFSMQDPNDGGVYFKFTEKEFSAYIMPHADRAKKYFMKKTTASSLNFASMMAKAYRSFKLFPELEAYADSCLKAAEKAFAWAVANPAIYYSNPADVKTGEYGDNAVADEFFFARAELFISTGKEEYYNGLNLGLTFRNPSWRNIETYGLMSLATNLDLLDMPEADKQIVRSKFLGLADANYAWAAGNPYRITAQNYFWGSNGDVANRGMIGYIAYRMTGEAKYFRTAEMSLNYLLGQNALNHSYITGFGYNYTRNPHDRRMIADEIVEPIPGYVSGGPNANPASDCPAGTYTSAFNAKKFADVYCSYSTNEIAVNWNGPLVFLAGAVDSEFTDLKASPVKAETNGGGTGIIIHYSDTVALVSGETEVLSVYINGAEAVISSVSVAEGKVALQLEDAVPATGAEIRLSVAEGWLVGRNGLLASGINDMYVMDRTSAGPAYLEQAAISPEGGKLFAIFSKPVNPASFGNGILQLLVTGENTGIEIISAQASDTLVLAVTGIYKEHVVSLLVNEGAFAADGSIVKPAVFMPVANYAPLAPAVPISAEINFTGLAVTVAFDKDLLARHGEKKFTANISRNGASIVLQPSSVSITGKIAALRFNFSDRFQFGDAVTVSYAGGEIYTASSEEPLLPFELLPAANPLAEPPAAVYTIGTLAAVQIKASSFWYNNGFQLEDCSEGGQNLAHTASGDYTDYYIDVKTAGYYNITFRVASFSSAGSVSMRGLDSSGSTTGAGISTFAFKATSGWQNWESFDGTIKLTEGPQVLRMQAAASNFNINWIEIGPWMGAELSYIAATEGNYILLPSPAYGLEAVYSMPVSSDIAIKSAAGANIWSGHVYPGEVVKFPAPGLYIIEAGGAGNAAIQLLPVAE